MGSEYGKNKDKNPVQKHQRGDQSYGDKDLPQSREVSRYLIGRGITDQEDIDAIEENHPSTKTVEAKKSQPAEPRTFLNKTRTKGRMTPKRTSTRKALV